MPGTTFAAIVASYRGRTGKTWLARLLAEHFILAVHKPLIFDTDALESPLAAAFPQAAIVDLERVPDQIAFFDALVAPGPEPRIVDVTHRSFEKFFKLLGDTDFVAEARARKIEPVIFYIPGREHDGFEQGRRIRERFDCPFVVVDNSHLGEPKPFTRRSPGYQAISAHPLRLALARLDPNVARLLDDPNLSIADYMRQPAADTPFAKGAGLRDWLIKGFREIWRVTKALDEGRAAHPPAETRKA